jgi:UDP-N-acetylmuramyl pentapeptide phosphotransferase/UDP-N-acetylglucosamine-1-phosphate transferase
MKIAGIILIVIGIIALVYQYIPITTTKQDAKIGSLEINHQETHEYPVQIVGGVLVVAGVAALALGGRSKL